LIIVNDNHSEWAGMFKKKSKLNGYRIQNTSPGAGWRGYQNQIKLHSEKSRAHRRIPRYLFLLVFLVLLTEGGFYILDHRTNPSGGESISLTIPDVEPLDHNGLRNLLTTGGLHNPFEAEFELSSDTGTFQVYTSIDKDLQTAIVNSLDTRHANRIGIVAIEPDTGRVLAMVSHNDDDPGANACLLADLPAASIFKIVTAAAALEKGPIPYHQQMAFNGGKFTLYRNQLTDKTNQYTNHVTMETAFAESINPVFGKLGKNLLGKDLLNYYGHAYYFNNIIEFDLPVEKSFLEISDLPYNWAEIASGFNRTTTLSPLHAAMIAGSVINGGKLMQPTIVDVTARDHKTVYRRRSTVLSQAVDPLTVDSLHRLMNATVHSGTASSQFKGISKDPILSKLDIGGKTGSLNNNARQIRYDWFAGYAEDPNGSGKIAIGIIVAHKEYIGKRAATYFRQAVSSYFQNRLEQFQDTKRTVNVGKTTEPGA
jgi:penicillin-binding protein A